MSEYVAYEETAGMLRLRVIADNDPLNPRTDWDHGSVMCCDHRRYNLGDDGAHDKVREMIRASRDYRPSWEDEDRADALDLAHGPDLWKAVQRCSDVVALPCYLYDHSGITMSVGGFACPWDSGQVGFIAIDKATILASFLKPAGSRLTAALKARAVNLLTSDVEVYDQYLTGDVYGYAIDKVDEDGDVVADYDGDSCWGIFGHDYAIEEGRAALAGAVKADPLAAAVQEEMAL